MSYLCDNCSKVKGVWGGCDKHDEGVRVGYSCPDFAPTLESVFKHSRPKDTLETIETIIDCCKFNGYPEPETKKMVSLLVTVIDEFVGSMKNRETI